MPCTAIAHRVMRPIFKPQGQRAIQRVGIVSEVVGQSLFAQVPSAVVGELVDIHVRPGPGGSVLGEVVSFDQTRAMISCLESVQGIGLGTELTLWGEPHRVAAHDGLLGQVLDGFGRPMRQGVLAGALVRGIGEGTPVLCSAPSALERPPISQALETGVSVIDACTTLGVGQRVGIFAEPGCGKSTLLAQIARGAHADVVVVSLVGERGRELREFIEREFDERINQRTVFVCATSDKTPIERVRAAFTATAIAEHFRDQGKSVLLMVDSLTRLARAQREIGMMSGEPISSTGFPPSVYGLLPALIERAGRTPKGDLTALFSVLLEGESISSDPIASEAKSLLDGHIVLSKKWVEQGQFPAVDILSSLSRVMSHVVPGHHAQAMQQVRSVLSRCDELDLLVKLNEYQSGADAFSDYALAVKPELQALFKQDRFKTVSMADTLGALSRVLKK